MTKEETYQAMSKALKARNKHLEDHECAGKPCEAYITLSAEWAKANDAYTPFADEELEHNFLLHLVDGVWGEAHEDQSVPSTDWAERMIAKAKDTFC